MLSLFALPVFAADETTSAETTAPAKEAAKGLSTAALVWIIIGAVLLVVAIVLCIKFRAKLIKGLRVYKSEFKKVSWLSWEQTRKSTLIVLVVLIAFAAVICLMDLGLSKGIQALILDVFKAPTK
ncbi:MAG: preprotein translocase subunit SecE [Clostridia bacterium]|nr:preprotein translocase subunit SecE [Clostridia bacterium]